MANFHDDSEPLPSFRPRRYTTLYCRRRRRRKFLVSFAPQLLKSSHGWYGLRSRWLAYSGASFLHLNNGLLFIYHRLLIPHDTSCRCFFFIALERISSIMHHDSTTLSIPMSSAGPRHSSTGEVTYLKRLVAKYGEDLEKMSKDRKLNPDQHTVGGLRRALRRAGLGGE